LFIKDFKAAIFFAFSSPFNFFIFPIIVSTNSLFLFFLMIFSSDFLVSLSSTFLAPLYALLSSSSSLSVGSFSSSSLSSSSVSVIKKSDSGVVVSGSSTSGSSTSGSPVILVEAIAPILLSS